MPRISREAKERNRCAILDAATVLFRRRGVDQVGIDQLMHEAGLTRGGFYNHFESKEALVAAACGSAFESSIAQLHAALDGYRDASPGETLRMVVGEYLSERHRDAPEAGCPTATLGVDIGRHGVEAQRRYAEGIEAYLDVFTELFTAADAGAAPDPAAGGGSTAARRTGGGGPEMARPTSGDPVPARARAIGLLSTLVGSMVLARAVREAGPGLSDEILAVARESAGALTR